MKSTRWLPAALLLTGASYAQEYRIDDGVFDNNGLISINTGIQSFGHLQAFSVPGGGQDMIRSMSVAIGVPDEHPSVQSLDGFPLTLAVWADPNGDGVPSDAVLLGTLAGQTVSQSQTGLLVSYDFAQPIPVSGSFFLGYSIDLPASGSLFYPTGGTDSSMSSIFRSYRVTNTAGTVDLQDLSNNSGPPTFGFVFGVYLIRGNSAPSGAPLGTASCAHGIPNSKGETSFLVANGNASQSGGGYSLRLVARDLPRGQFGYFLASQATAAPTTPPGSQGQLCLGGPILRIHPSVARVSETGMMAWEVDVNNVDSLGAGVPGFDVIQAGQTWSFQAWHRDRNPGPTSNFTEMLSVSFQ